MRRRRNDPVDADTYWWVRARDKFLCVAPVLDPQAGPCSGEIELDHVKDEPRMGKRAPSDRDHLVSVCEGHSEKGAKAGYQWNTANRPLLREYLALMREQAARLAGVDS
jgi:hypothetical protein